MNSKNMADNTVEVPLELPKQVKHEVESLYRRLGETDTKGNFIDVDYVYRKTLELSMYAASTGAVSLNENKKQPFPYTAYQRVWLDDLKTTEEPQTVGALHRLEACWGVAAGYCCLGRACVVAGVEEKIKGGIGSFDGRITKLPVIVWKKLQLRGPEGLFKNPVSIGGAEYHALTNLNDTLKLSFKQIAEWIEENPELVFTNCETNLDE